MVNQLATIAPMTDKLATTTPGTTTPSPELLARAAKMALNHLKSDGSKRVYAQTFKAWGVWALENDIAPYDPTPESIQNFCNDGDYSKATRQRRLSIMRALMKHLYLIDERFGHLYARVKETQIGGKDTDRHNERNKRALPPREVFSALDVWNDNTKLSHIRNRALLAVAFYAGLRRSEIVALKWSDISLGAGLITVQRGKGDKERVVPILADALTNALKLWRKEQGRGRDYVFCAINKAGRLGDDQPITAQAAYKVIKASGDFAPHDARRTMITDALNNGASVADVQFIAGHSNPATTLNYAKQKDALSVKGRVKLGY